MRTTGALLFSHRGPALFPLLSLYVFSLFSPLPGPARLASFPEITAQSIGRGEDHTPKEQGMLIWRSGNIHEKASTGPHSLHNFLIPGHTHTLLRRLITAGDFLPPRGPRTKGAKTQSSDTTHIGLYT